MKKYLRIVLVTLLSTGVIFSCKKNSTPKDYTLSIKDKTWWGILTNTGQAPEYYSIHFNAGNTLLLSRLNGDFPGQWVMIDKQITISVSTFNIQITADISDDNKLMNMVANTGTYIINSGELIENPNLPLDNTVWKGSASLASSIPVPIQMSFIAGTKVEVKWDNTTLAPVTYVRSASGAVIRFSIGASQFFEVVTSGSEMKGANINNYKWQIAK